MEESSEKTEETTAEPIHKRIIHHGKRAIPHVKKAALFSAKYAAPLLLLFILAIQFVPNSSGTYPWGGIWMRMQSKELLVADSAAGQSVNNFLLQQASDIVSKQYPNLPDANRQKVLEDSVNQLRKDRKQEIANEQKRLAGEIRDHFSYDVNGTKYTYMPDIDPYYYLRFARNIVEKGHIYDELIEGVGKDTHTYAPIGSVPEGSWHPYVLAGLYSIGSVFDKNITLMEAAGYMPVVVIFLSLILVFLVTRKVGGNFGAVFAVTILALLPAVFGRTPWGHADTDAYNVLFPLLGVYLLFEALGAKSHLKQAIFAILAGLSVAVYTKFWSGWWYSLDFMLGALVVAFVAEVTINVKKGWPFLKNDTHLKKFLVVGLALFFASLAFGSYLTGPQVFITGVFQGAISFTSIKNAAFPSLWPNVFTTVAELNPSSLDAVVDSAGGMLLFVFAALGIVILIVKKDEHGRYDFTYSALLALWFAGTIYAAVKGIRFTLLLGPAFAVAFGASAGLCYNWLCSFSERQLHVNRVITTIMLTLILAFVIMGPTQSGQHIIKDSYGQAVNDIPLVNDAWFNVLTKIKTDSQPNAIINSWWDFGHHFKFIADRRVTFDGGNQNTPPAHWIGKALQTSNEQEAIGILRMLDCGSVMAFEYAINSTKDPIKAIDLVKNMILVDKTGAIALAKKAGVDEGIVRYTHCDPPEDYFIASADMIGKAGVWAHFGLWDFKKAEVWQKWKNLPQEEAVPQMAERFNWTTDEATQVYNDAVALSGEDAANNWIGPFVGYFAEPAGCQRSSALVTCGSAIKINLTEKKAEVRVNQGIALAGKLIIYDKAGNASTTALTGGSDNLAVVIWPDGKDIKGMAVPLPLAESMFTRMFYMNGLGLKHFKPFTQDRQLFGGMIYAFKVDWNGTENYVPANLQPKSEIDDGAEVKMSYVGWTDEGTVFDSSIPDWRSKNVTKDTSLEAFKTEPLAFTFGQNRLIPGFEKRIKGMKVGDTKTITIPPTEAYGVDPNAHPLGNKTLHFKVRVDSVQ